MNKDDIKVTDIKIYMTDNYSVFKPLLGNRDQKGEGKIIESIQAAGQIKEPILVNEKYEVIDGQNRLKAFEELSLPVYFMIIPGLTIDHCRWLNIGQTNWGIYDFISSYARKGDANYQRLQSLINSYGKKLPLEGIFAMAQPLKITEGGVYTNSLKKEGWLHFSQSEYELAVARISSAIDFGYVEFGKRKKFTSRIYWACISYIYQDANVNAKDILQRLLEHEAAIPAVNSVSEQLRYFDNELNKELRKKDKVFLQADFLKRDFLEGDSYAK